MLVKGGEGVSSVDLRILFRATNEKNPKMGLALAENQLTKIFICSEQKCLFASRYL